MAEGFFDHLEKLSAQKRGKNPDAPKPTDAANDPNAPKPISVSQITSLIEKAIKAGVPATVYVKGEISNYSLHRASGHHYFSLKDDKSVISSVMFAREAVSLKFIPKDGMEVIITGRISVYGARGQYQLYATRMDPVGQGSLELAFRQLKEKLEKEGLFDPERKKPLPIYPRTIALLTGKETAALQDMLKVLRAFPWLRILHFDVPVQGASAAPKIVDAIHSLARYGTKLGIEAIILARGGGSLEDLWAFNEEIVARAMVKCSIPIITGIGHEVDVSIADLVADYHAHTPTEAARVITANWKLAKDSLEIASDKLKRELMLRLKDARQQLDSVSRHELFRRPMDRINSLKQLLDDRQRSLTTTLQGRAQKYKNRLNEFIARLAAKNPRQLIQLKSQQILATEDKLDRGMKFNVRRYSEKLDSIARHLEALGPLSVLNRGYSITANKKTGKTIRSADELTGGETIVTRFKDGARESIVEDPNQPRLF